MRSSHFDELLKFYKTFIDQENVDGFSAELQRWQTKWRSIRSEEKPTTIFETLKSLGPEGLVSVYCLYQVNDMYQLMNNYF